MCHDFFFVKVKKNRITPRASPTRTPKYATNFTSSAGAVFSFHLVCAFLCIA